MPTVEFVGSSRQDADNISASPARLVNLYRERSGESRYSLKSVLGTAAFADTLAPVGRKMATVNSTVYAAAGGQLHEITSSGSSTILGTIVDDVDTIIDGYNANVTLSAGGRYYVYDGLTVTQITGGAFSSIGSVAFLGGYTVLTEKNGSRFEWTALQDPATRNALNVKTAEGRDDKLLRAIALNGNLYLMGTQSIEAWYITGLAGASAFARLSGGVLERGLKAKRLVTVFGDGAFFVGNDGIAYILGGGTLAPVSSPSVETAIEQGDPTHCYYYEDEGHKFCVLRFSGRPAWVYDISTGEWHERASGNTLGAWGALDATKAFGKWLILDAAGAVPQMTRSNQDLGATLLRKAVSKTFEIDEERFIVSRLVARSRKGFADIGRAAEIILRLSKDGGHNWSPAKHRSIGGLGEYRTRAVWRNQGQFRTLTAEFTMADPADIPLYSDMVLDV